MPRKFPEDKPVSLVADAIKDCSRRGGIILDPFVGSGTTVIAAERTGRKARVMEIDPKYVDVAVRRWECFTGKKAINARTQLTFEEQQAKILDRKGDDVGSK
jgi:DNA modification methylase